MKTFLTTLALILTLTTTAQTYKIVISYDAGGNRIKRERVCTDCPTLMSASVPDTTLAMDTTAYRPIAESLSTVEDLQLFPNPTQGKASLVVSEDILLLKPQILIVDIAGRVIRQSNLIDKLTIIDLDGCPE